MSLLATYEDKRLDGRQCVELHETHVRIVLSTLGSTHATEMPLATLDPAVRRVRRMAQGFGEGVTLAVAALATKALLGVPADNAMGRFLLGMIATGIVLTLLRAYRVDWAVFRQRNGAPAFTLARSGAQKRQFGEFVERVVAQASLVANTPAHASTAFTGVGPPALVGATAPGGLRLFRVAGVPVYANRSFLIVAATILGISWMAGWSGIFDLLFYVVVIFVHEGGHALAARLVGLKVHAVVITGDGGRCHAEAPRGVADALLLYGGGVFAQLVLLALAVAWLLQDGRPDGIADGAVARVLVGLNLLLVLGNLMPSRTAQGAVSDGTVILDVLLHRFRGAPNPFAPPPRHSPVFARETRLVALPGFAPPGFAGGVEFLNDDNTPMDFVVDVLQRHVALEHEAAVALMLRIDAEGGALVPVADAGAATRIADAVMRDAREAGNGVFVCRAVAAPRLWDDVPTFGTLPDGIAAADRPGAYAILLDADGRIGIVATPIGCFLPGGGCDPGESPEATLRREVIEECGLACTVERLLGEAVQFAYSSADQRHYRKHGHYFLARAGARVAAPIEADHVLEWVAPEAAAGRLAHAAQAWVVTRFLAAQAP